MSSGDTTKADGPVRIVKSMVGDIEVGETGRASVVEVIVCFRTDDCAEIET